ncbi:hypothetical protein QR98_0024920 [Sarcoptes scabiei]|uniref:Uncharacterized protein n=1 Tax=Sarcoptes scabiei TaxID=52283 RepID=A0A131ZZF2_SARSC|nr:hypothetical protein QR98_0024920 [Sarcoptes scabiei]
MLQTNFKTLYQRNIRDLKTDIADAVIDKAQCNKDNDLLVTVFQHQKCSTIDSKSNIPCSNLIDSTNPSFNSANPIALLPFETPPIPKTLEELLEFQWMHSAHILVSQDDRENVSLLMQKLNGSMNEKRKLSDEVKDLHQKVELFDSILELVKQIVTTANEIEDVSLEDFG